MHTNVEIGPLYGETLISSGLDYYKPTMGQLQYERYPDAQVTFTLKNRGDNRLLDYIQTAKLERRLERFQHGWQKNETAVLAHHQRRDGNPLFNNVYLDYLVDSDLPPVAITVDKQTNDLAVQTTGDWPLVTNWETVVMSEINELYFENYIQQNNLDIMAVYEEGDRRLSQKIERLKNRPDIKFAEFGTRRRFSYRWQRHVLSRLVRECPDNLIGTSNVQLAEEFDLMPIGTFAHEMPMVYAALHEATTDDPLDGHNKMLNDWDEKYDNNLSTALTDTFGSDFFFAEFIPEQAKKWQGLRHDSGDPYKFGEQVISFYEENGVDPTQKTIVFSDGLDIETIINLADHFLGRINIVFGWGTSLTNDLGLQPNNIVMKATQVNGIDTVKLSDNIGKYTGTKEAINRYLDAKAKRLGKISLVGVAR